MQKKYDVAIIGAGIVGSMLAYKLSRYRLRVALIDKALDVAEGISKANSGVLHAGFNVPTGTLKAQFNLQGLKQYPHILKRLKVPYGRCKKLVVAFDGQQKVTLEKLLAQGQANGCTGLKIIGESQIKKMGVRGKWALYSPQTAIVGPYQLTTTLAENAQQNGVDVLLGSEVTAITEQLKLTLNGVSEIEATMVINSAGIFSDKVASLLGPHPYKIYPCRGEYYILDKNAGSELSMAIYPVPLHDGRSLGVHLTPTLNGNILIGPSAEYQQSRSDVGNEKEVMEMLKSEAYQLLPQLKDFSFIKNYAGLRPKLSANGFSDFVIEPAEQNSKMINLLGIESPGLTAAPAIADHLIKNYLAAYFKLSKKFFLKKYFPILHPNLDQRKKLSTKDPNFGKMVCRCEQISRAEIDAALSNPLGSQTLASIKKRTHAMMGRCQGSYCQSQITEILKEKMPAQKICKTSSKSNLYTGERS